MHRLDGAAHLVFGGLSFGAEGQRLGPARLICRPALQPLQGDVLFVEGEIERGSCYSVTGRGEGNRGWWRFVCECIRGRGNGGTSCVSKHCLSLPLFRLSLSLSLSLSLIRLYNPPARVG